MTKKNKPTTGRRRVKERRKRIEFMDFVSAIRCAVLYGRYGAALWATFESKRVALLLQVDNMSRRRVNDAKDIVTMSDRMVDAKDECTTTRQQVAWLN